jgi:hypothetical protein
MFGLSKSLSGSNGGRRRKLTGRTRRSIPISIAISTPIGTEDQQDPSKRQSIVACHSGGVACHSGGVIPPCPPVARPSQRRGKAVPSSPLLSSYSPVLLFPDPRGFQALPADGDPDLPPVAGCASLRPEQRATGHVDFKASGSWGGGARNHSGGGGIGR